METLEATVASKPDPILEEREEKFNETTRNGHGLEEKCSGTVCVENTEAVEQKVEELKAEVRELRSDLRGVITFISSFNTVRNNLVVLFYVMCS